MADPGTSKPAWLIESLGPAGAAYVNPEDFAPPPESSLGCLFHPDRIENGYYVEEIADGVYWVSSGWYDTMFIRLNLSRGDRRWTFPNDAPTPPLLWPVLPQPLAFAADQFFRLASRDG